MTYKKFLKVALERHFFDEHDQVLIAVSGGYDSMNLLGFLYDCKAQLGISIAIAHINHGQRAESVQEEAYLKKLAQQLQVPIYIGHFSGSFSETKARDFRYQFFKEVMVSQGYTALVTAHHAGDQAETVLMRLLRGSRVLHLSSIKERQPFATGELIRPFLGFNKEDFPPLFHFEDASNQTDAYLRNRIRQTYLPLLSQENPQLSNHLLQMAQEVTYLNTTLDELTQAIDITALEVFHGFSAGTQYILFQRYLKKFPDLKLTQAQFEQALHIIQTKANYQHRLKAGYTLFKDYQHFAIKKISPKTDSGTSEKVLNFGSVTNYDGYSFSFGKLPEGPSYAVAVQGVSPITLRHRKAGDRILINGHNKKISRYLIDKKIPQNQREAAIVIEQNQTVLAILDLVSSDLSKLSKSDIMRTKLYIQKIKDESE